MRSDYKARRGLRAFVAATVISLALGALVTSAGAAPPTTAERGQRGAEWLANQIKANHGFVKSFGVADPTSTAYAVIAMRAAGVDKPASDLAIRYLWTKLGTPLQLGGKDSPGALAQYILAAVADNQDPRKFGGTGAENNLVTRLLATSRGTGPDAGLFGVQDPTYDGSYRQGLALAALKAAAAAPGKLPITAGIAWLKKQQCTNGLWMSYRANPATVCPAANPNTFTGPDTNSTSLAVQGLAAWGQRPRRTAVLQSLDAVQSSTSAGFPFIAAPNQAADPNSTALVIQAIIAEQESATATRWLRGTQTPFGALVGFQLGCAQPGYGAFFYPGSTAPNVFATVQAVPAMMKKTLLVTVNSASVIVPLTPC